MVLPSYPRCANVTLRDGDRDNGDRDEGDRSGCDEDFSFGQRPFGFLYHKNYPQGHLEILMGLMEVFFYFLLLFCFCLRR